jgi:hypothetical protein
MPFSMFSRSSVATDASFIESWSILDQQLPHITSLEISPAGIWLVSASEDGTVLFIEAGSGYAMGTLDLGDCFHILSTIWHSNLAFFAGGSNGVVYDVTFNPHVVSRLAHICDCDANCTSVEQPTRYHSSHHWTPTPTNTCNHIRPKPTPARCWLRKLSLDIWPWSTRFDLVPA